MTGIVMLSGAKHLPCCWRSFAAAQDDTHQDQCGVVPVCRPRRPVGQLRPGACPGSPPAPGASPGASRFPWHAAGGGV